jgi:hypothetical protein
VPLVIEWINAMRLDDCLNRLDKHGSRVARAPNQTWARAAASKQERAATGLHVGRDQDRHAIADDVLHLALMPVAGVGQHDVGILQADRAQLALGGADHRLEVSEVRGVRS